MEGTHTRAKHRDAPRVGHIRHSLTGSHVNGVGMGLHVLQPKMQTAVASGLTFTSMATPVLVSTAVTVTAFTGFFAPFKVANISSSDGAIPVTGALTCVTSTPYASMHSTHLHTFACVHSHGAWCSSEHDTYTCSTCDVSDS
eukprot:363259-Chlamydomonas_euryale.AAC.6